MKRLQAIKEQLVSQVEAQMTDLSCVDTEELGEVIDMIKDLAKAIYYCQVVSAMEEDPSKKKTYGQNALILMTGPPVEITRQIYTMTGKDAVQ